MQRALELAKQPFDAESARVPSELSKLTYSYRETRFRRDKALWREGGSDFRLLPFHLGFLHDKSVQVHIINHGNAIPIAFSTGLPTGGAAEFSYHISALSTTWHLHPYAQVQQSSNGSDIEDGISEGQGTKRFIVDFAGGDLAYCQSEPDRLERFATTTAGAITTKILAFNAPLKGVRAIVDATLPDGQSAELRMFLKSRNRTLSETWTATWSVPPGDSIRSETTKK